MADKGETPNKTQPIRMTAIRGRRRTKIAGKCSRIRLSNVAELQKYHEIIHSRGGLLSDGFAKQSEEVSFAVVDFPIGRLAKCWDDERLFEPDFIQSRLADESGRRTTHGELHEPVFSIPPNVSAELLAETLGDAYLYFDSLEEMLNAGNTEFIPLTEILSGQTCADLLHDLIVNRLSENSEGAFVPHWDLPRGGTSWPDLLSVGEDGLPVREDKLRSVEVKTRQYAYGQPHLTCRARSGYYLVFNHGQATDRSFILEDEDASQVNAESKWVGSIQMYYLPQSVIDARALETKIADKQGNVKTTPKSADLDSHAIPVELYRNPLHDDALGRRLGIGSSTTKGIVTAMIKATNSMTDGATRMVHLVLEDVPKTASGINVLVKEGLAWLKHCGLIMGHSGLRTRSKKPPRVTVDVNTDTFQKFIGTRGSYVDQMETVLDLLKKAGADRETILAQTPRSRILGSSHVAAFTLRKMLEITQDDYTRPIRVADLMCKRKHKKVHLAESDAKGACNAAHELFTTKEGFSLLSDYCPNDFQLFGSNGGLAELLKLRLIRFDPVKEQVTLNVCNKDINVAEVLHDRQRDTTYDANNVLHSLKERNANNYLALFSLMRVLKPGTFVRETILTNAASAEMKICGGTCSPHAFGVMLDHLSGSFKRAFIRVDCASRQRKAIGWRSTDAHSSANRLLEELAYITDTTDRISEIANSADPLQDRLLKLGALDNRYQFETKPALLKLIKHLRDIYPKPMTATDRLPETSVPVLHSQLAIVASVGLAETDTSEKKHEFRWNPAAETNDPDKAYIQHLTSLPEETWKKAKSAYEARIRDAENTPIEDRIDSLFQGRRKAIRIGLMLVCLRKILAAPDVRIERIILMDFMSAEFARLEGFIANKTVTGNAINCLCDHCFLERYYQGAIFYPGQMLHPTKAKQEIQLAGNVRNHSTRLDALKSRIAELQGTLDELS